MFFGWWRRRRIDRRTRDLQQEIAKQIAAAVPAMTKRWLYFCDKLKFHGGLHGQISAFIPPALEFLHRHHPIVFSDSRGVLPPLIIMTAIAEAGTHSKSELDRACMSIWPYLFDDTGRLKPLGPPS